MAVFLAFGMIQLITHPDQHVASLIPLFLMQMAVGGIIGVSSSYLMRYIINRIRLEYDGLYPVLSIAFVLSIYGITTLLNGNGFLAIYLAGLLMGRHDFIHKNSLGNFHDGLAWLMQITMFLVLGLQVFPSRLVDIAPEGILTAVVLIFIARPLSVFLLTIHTRLATREKAFISWVGLRGAAPIILATFTQLSDVELPLPIFELVFFVVLVSVTLQGITVIQAAKRLDLLVSSAPPSPPQSKINSNQLRESLVHSRVSTGSDVVGKQVLDIPLPEDTLIVAISRATQIIVPRGSTVMEANDEVLILTAPQQQEHIRKIFTQQG
jgi:cell volume regulation protein A